MRPKVFLMDLLALLAWGATASLAAEPAAPNPAAGAANVHRRGSLDNCRVQFEQKKQGLVAFLGGSITEMEGYRPMVCEILKRRFPETRFTFINAGISSTCSTTGAFRLQSDVLDRGPVDLLFVEFAVNDDQDAHHTRRDCIRGMEGIVRRALRHNPDMDVVMTHFVNPEIMATIRSGGTPLTIDAHEAVAGRYDISTINLAKEVTQRIAGGQLTWKQFGGVHPAPFGNAICAGMIDRLMSEAWPAALAADARKKPRSMPERLMSEAWPAALAADARKKPHSMPEPLDTMSYSDGRFIDPKTAAIAGGARIEVPDWKHLAGSSRGRFTQLPILVADRPGDEVSLRFSGTAIGAYVLAGPDAGVVEARIDGGEAIEVNLLHAYSAGLHYPRTVMFAADLKPGSHVLVLRVAEKTHGAGHAVRIMQFVANGEP